MENRDRDASILYWLTLLVVGGLACLTVALGGMQWWRQYDDPASRSQRARRDIELWSWSSRLHHESASMLHYYDEHPECRPVIGAWSLTSPDRTGGHDPGHCRW